MKNKFTLLIFTILTIASNAQTGINTKTPNATLDIKGNPDDINIIDGVITPRITGDKLRLKTNYSSIHKGAIIYVTTADTAPSGQTINVKKEGYYYFDGVIWQNLISTTSHNDTEPWLETSTTKTATNNSQNLYKNGKVGLGNFSNEEPIGNLHIKTLHTSVYLENYSPDILAPNLILRKSRNNTSINNNDLLGNLQFGGYTNAFYQRAEISGIVDATPTEDNLPTALIFSTGTTELSERLRISSSGNLGIGTNNPAYKLDIATGGTAILPKEGFRLVDGNQTKGKVLTSDSDGIGTWKDIQYEIVRGYFTPTTSISDHYVAGSPSKNLGAYITLPPGAWEVETNLLINPGNLGSNSYTFLRFGFSDSPTGVAITGDIITQTVDGRKIAPNISGTNITFDYTPMPDPSPTPSPEPYLGDSYYSIINGKVTIINSSIGNKTYYLFVADAQYKGAQRTFYSLGKLEYTENMISARRAIDVQ